MLSKKKGKILLDGVSSDNLVDVNKDSRIVFEILAKGSAYRLETISTVLEADGWLCDGNRIFLTVPKNALSQPEMIRAVHDAVKRVQYLLKTSGIEYEMRIASEDQIKPTGSVLKAKIGLVGDQKVGKTSLIRRYVLDQFSDKHIRTIGAKVSKKQVYLDFHEGKAVRVDMMVWDIIGERHLAELHMKEYYVGVQGILVVIDITRRKTLAGVEDWLSSVLDVTGEVPIHLLVNKCDLEDRFDMEGGEVADLSTRIRSPFMFTSARTGKNVEAAFADLAMKIAIKSGKTPQEALKVAA
ncbi:MAG: GTP-binding protein [Candidatus Thermoplasmatota archaeon]|nr:GTP-binding protein [Candidatus Thermoplasmatota archaeon]